MQIILFLVALICFFISFFMLLKKNIHIFQINFYKVKPQLKWIAKNISKDIISSILYVLAGISVFFGNYGIIAFSVLMIITAIINMERKVKKPIVYTARVKRMIFTAYIVSIIIGLITYLTFKDIYIVLIVAAYMNIFAPFVVLLANAMNLPINKIINNRYIDETRKKIESMPNLVVIGVTGSYGKTSVKNFLYKCLSAKYNVLITPENYNTTLGVVKTIREYLKATHEIFVCEMGATNVNDIKEICDLVHPKYGIITSIGPQHLESFGSMENIINTKFELADSIPNDGIIFLNYDNEYIKNKDFKGNVISYGVDNQEVDYTAYDLVSTSSGINFKIKSEDNEEYKFSSRVIGKHNIQNIVGAIAVADKLGVPVSNLVNKVRQIEPVEHRLQVIKRGNDIIIDDAYNSNPVGSKSAVDTLATFDGVKILVTPGMIELGEQEYKCNFDFGIHSASKCDYIVLVGKDQTRPIQDGIKTTDFDKSKLIVVDTLKEAMEEIYKLDVGSKQRVILLENDLPDNY